MPEIKLKHVVSFSTEDRVHKAENLLKPETYRKWKCASPGLKNASVILQFEKASKIQSIDIGNECSAFVEVLVGRSSDSVNDFQVLLVASSFMSPLESRTGTHTNRVRMFGPEKLSQNVRDEKWDRVQIVCTQPFNKNITYGLTFIKFHSPSEKNAEESPSSEAQKATTKIHVFNLKSDSDDDDEESLLTVGSWFGKKKENSQDTSDTTINKESPSYAAAVLASSSNSPKFSQQNNVQKRKIDNHNTSKEPPPKKTSALNKEYITYKSVIDDEITENKKLSNSFDKGGSSNKQESKKASASIDRNDLINKPSTSSKPDKPKKKIPFNKIMDKVVFVLSGFVNPLRSELREKGLEMGATYKGDWDNTCTHLICAFINTPKYIQVRGDDGRIVTKEWIIDCYKKKTLLPWRSYMLGTYTKDSTEESNDTDEESVDTRTKNHMKANDMKANNIVSSPNKRNERNNVSFKNQPQSTPKNIASTSKDKTDDEDDETEDEDAISDYIADTDVDSESDSGGDTEDEIQKVESKARKMKKEPSNKLKDSPKKSVVVEKPDVSDLPLPELPNIFKQKHFFLYGKLAPSKHHDLQRYITAYNGVLQNYMTSATKYVITEAKWDQEFEDAVSENEDLIFVKPLWIYKCHEAGKFVPFQPYIITPDS